ncbi:unnamed protein product [Cercospora beticola]|nr:unnamed protein product [Cercospora beticola]
MKPFTLLVALAATALAIPNPVDEALVVRAKIPCAPQGITPTYNDCTNCCSKHCSHICHLQNIKTGKGCQEGYLETLCT